MHTTARTWLGQAADVRSARVVRAAVWTAERELLLLLLSLHVTSSCSW